MFIYLKNIIFIIYQINHNCLLSLLLLLLLLLSLRNNCLGYATAKGKKKRGEERRGVPIHFTSVLHLTEWLTWRCSCRSVEVALVLIYFVKFNFLSECVKANEAQPWRDVCSCAWQRKLANPKDRTNSCFKEHFQEFISFLNINSQLPSFAEFAINTPVCIEECLSKWCVHVHSDVGQCVHEAFYSIFYF